MPNSLSSIVFTLDSHLSLSWSLGVCQHVLPHKMHKFFKIILLPPNPQIRDP
jgi:hypothetical protein